MDHDPTHQMLLTMAASIAAGVLLIAASHRLHVSAISLLLVGGIALGPEGIGFVQPESLGPALRVVVSLAVGLILFEGGLSLDVRGFRSASGTIRRMLTLGVLTTWLVTAAAVYVLFDVVLDQPRGLAFALLCGSLVIVTGPTVIAPLLKRIRVQPRVHGILHWEGVLIDPIGVFVAVLCFEWITLDDRGMAVLNFVTRLGAGGVIGLAGGFSLSALFRTRLIPDDMSNVVAIAAAMVVFGLSEAILPETGLLSVTIAGFVLGTRGRERLRGLREFKAEITELMIGLLFILLSARLELAQFAEFGASGALLVAIVVFVVRPMAVWASSAGQGLFLQEKVFLSLVAPRGIVAASMGSLVALTLARHGDAEAGKFAETFVYSVIATTVLLQGGTAGAVARALGLRRPQPQGWLIIGAHALGRRVARFVQSRGGVQALLIDSNARSIALARDRGVEAIYADALDVEELEERDEILGIGNVLALTDNEDLNEIICQRWADVVGPDHVHRWASRARIATTGERTAGRVLWPDLPKPSMLSTELERGDARTFTESSISSGEVELVTPLLTLDGGGARAVVADEVLTDRETLFLRRSGNYLLRSLRRNLLLRLDVDTPQDLLTHLVDAIVTEMPDLSRSDLARKLSDHEMVVSSLLGGGIAVPHETSRAIESHVCALALVPRGVDLGAPDGEPVRLIFMLLSPHGDPEGHLATLSEIAHLVADPAVREHLLDSATPRELLTRLLETAAHNVPLPEASDEGVTAR
jgi:NhaP-type Na+/H+ or K+/H+ antiporter/mannitol/fructose-specific phosphotransferase system IIA component (Ntr-type)